MGGNHEDEEGWNLDDMPASKAINSIKARKEFIPTPVDQGPNGFYTGNTDPLTGSAPTLTTPSATTSARTTTPSNGATRSSSCSTRSNTR